MTQRRKSTPIERRARRERSARRALVAEEKRAEVERAERATEEERRQSALARAAVREAERAEMAERRQRITRAIEAAAADLALSPSDGAYVDALVSKVRGALPDEDPLRVSLEVIGWVTQHLTSGSPRSAATPQRPALSSTRARFSVAAMLLLGLS